MTWRPPVVLLLAFAVTLAACGGGGDADPTPTSTRRATRTPTATASPTRTATPTFTSTPVPALTPTPRPAGSGQPNGPNQPSGGQPPRQTAGLSLPGGFGASVVAEGLYRPTSVAVAPDGTVYVSERHGPVYRLTSGGRTRVATFSGDVTGIAVSPGGELYVSSTGRVSVVRGGGAQTIISGLPHGRHQNNGIAFAGGKMYVTNGSTCDDCVEANARSATILQANLDGSGLRVYARGLRNPYDLVFDSSGQLWATDNGSDTPCGTSDELNRIVDGGDYGWPYRPQCDSFHDGIAPVANLGLHTASTGIDYYDGAQFPGSYRGDLFLTLWGSLFAPPELAPALYHVRGSSAQRFASGFSNPIDVAMDRDGSLLVLDYGSGRLFRIRYG
ncbi:MAG: PQQ-dependent sugar dehydrogenase [Dehalococcoidia bacterium]